MSLLSRRLCCIIPNRKLGLPLLIVSDYRIPLKNFYIKSCDYLQISRLLIWGAMIYLSLRYAPSTSRILEKNETWFHNGTHIDFNLNAGQ